MSEIANKEAPTLFQINGPIGYQNWKDYCADLKDTDLYSWLMDKSLAITGEDGGVYGIPYVCLLYTSEYVYIPLGGNRKGLPRQLFNILVVWMLTGIWHGAGWNFLFWGLWFAFFLILEKLFLGDILESVPKVFGRIYTLAVVLISWVFFARCV